MKKRTHKERDAALDGMEDLDISEKTSEQRKFIKVKRKPKQNDMLEEIEFEDSQEESFEEEDVIQRADSSDEDWEDCDKDSDEAMDEVKPLTKDEPNEKIWDSNKEPLNENEEELDYDGSAYEMLHRSKVEWPCLSLDFILRERVSVDGPSNPKAWFPA